MSRPDFLAIMRAEEAPARGFPKEVQGGIAALYMPPGDGPSLAGLFRRPGAGTGRRRARAAALVARQKALEALHACGDVLPALPGARLDPREAQAALAANRPAVDAGLAAVHGRAQRQATILWDLEAAPARFRDRLGGASGPDALAALARELAAPMERGLRAASEAALSLPCDGPEMILNLALLGGREEDAALEAALEAADAVWTEGLRIRLIGPSPAIAFAAARLRRLRPGEAVAAARALGLDAEALPQIPEIQAAFAGRIRAAAEAGEEVDAGALKSARDLLLRLRAAQEGLARAGLSPAGRRGAPPLLEIHREGDVDLPGAPGRSERAA